MHIGLVLAKLTVVALGLLISLQAVRASRREQGGRMVFVACGFGLLTVGSVLESVLYDVVHLSVFLAGMIQTAVIACGMVLLLYSLSSAVGESALDSATNEREL